MFRTQAFFMSTRVGNLSLQTNQPLSMTERLLQFIWQFQYFNKQELTAETGEPLRIIFPGQHNQNQGPDFTDAKVVIGNTTWAGTVELHLQSSGWQKHRHDTDSNYKNVILHVVWENDTPVTGSIPLLVLQHRVATLMLNRYRELMTSTSFIPCEKSIQDAGSLVWQAWKERLAAERLIRKAQTALRFLDENRYHWEETCWWLLAKNFGMKVNAEAFEAVARSLPLTILAKHKQQIHQLESLLLGQAGLLNDRFEEDYPRLLQREYQFLKTKYSLTPVPIPVHWLRMRPGNFPTLRLAQLAMLIHTSVHLFSRIKEAASAKEVRAWFAVTANDYWHYHYRFDETSPFKKKQLGAAMIDNIIINSLAPLLFTYGNYHNQEVYKRKALRWLEETAAEKNVITRGFVQIGVKAATAFDSQALLELKNQYCQTKHCLDCAVGNAILKKQMP